MVTSPFFYKKGLTNNKSCAIIKIQKGKGIDQNEREDY
jgi:hypothetical protein